MKKVTIKPDRVDNKNILANDTEALKVIEYQKEWLDWFWELTSDQKNFAVIALIKNLDKETLRKAKKWVR